MNGGAGEADHKSCDLVMLIIYFSYNTQRGEVLQCKSGAEVLSVVPVMAC